jgi:diguanylate cyclase (GGDEF)-like protein
MSRNRFCRRAVCLQVLFAALAPAASAQVLPFEILGLRDGLPQSQISCFAQDLSGYIWVGTWGGLARYNGAEFASFGQGPNLPSDRIQELLVDPSGSVWVATAGGLSFYEGHALRRADDPLVSEVRCRALALDGEGVLWVGTDKGVVYKRGSEFVRVAPAAQGETRPLYDILAASDGLYAAGEAGLWRLGIGGEPQAVPGPPGVSSADYRALLETAEGLWLGCYTNGLWLKDSGGWRRAEAMTAASVYRLSSGPSGTMYVATNGAGLFMKAAGRMAFERWDTSNGLPSNVVNFAFEDREGNLWVGTDIGGLARLGGKSATNHTVKQGLPDSCVFGISAGDGPDSLWLGTLRGAVHYRVHPAPRVLEIIQAPDGLTNEWVWKARRSADGTLWILSDTDVQFRRPGEKALRRPGPDIPLPRVVPWDMAEDGDGRLWFCGQGRDGGLSAQDRSGRWFAWNESVDGRDFPIGQHLAPRKRGGVWVTSQNRVFACDGRALSPLEPPAPFPESAQINAVFEDSRGRLWAGTDAGLARLGTGRNWETLDDRPGFANRHIFFLGEDARGTVWVCTARGVFRFRADDRVEPFSPDDGLADWEMNQYGFFCDGRGEVWLGTVSGLSQYRPAAGAESAALPLLNIESVDLPGRTIPFPAALDLGWRERTLNFHVAVLSFRNRAKTVYRARMENLEEDWTLPRRSAELRYTNMPPGRFTLLVQAANESGAWSEPLRLPLRVRPPFWRTPFFQGSLVLLLLAAVFGGHVWRTALIRRRNRELEAEVAVRTEDLRKANDRLTYLATYDPLTGLLNRRAVMETIGREAEPGTGGNRQFGCVLVDLNKFKQANDTLGHAAGDGVLKDMARQIKAYLRDSDSLGRIGGDEFLVVLPGADPEAVRSVCRRISAASSEAAEGGKTVVVTASCGGVAVRGRSGATVAAVIARADALLYESKRSGGGCRVDVFVSGRDPGEAGA